MTYPIYATLEAETLPTGTYLGLFHGRTDPKQSLDDWGFPGPVIGPVNWVHITYASEMKVALLGECDASLVIPVVEGCAEFEAKFYGDWTIYQHIQRRVTSQPVDVERRKT